MPDDVQIQTKSNFQVSIQDFNSTTYRAFSPVSIILLSLLLSFFFFCSLTLFFPIIVWNELCPEWFIVRIFIQLIHFERAINDVYLLQSNVHSMHLSFSLCSSSRNYSSTSSIRCCHVHARLASDMCDVSTFPRENTNNSARIHSSQRHMRLCIRQRFLEPISGAVDIPSFLKFSFINLTLANWRFVLLCLFPGSGAVWPTAVPGNLPVT